jgi:excinuclease UvrABC helicase subunit UvrB
MRSTRQFQIWALFSVAVLLCIVFVAYLSSQVAMQAAYEQKVSLCRDSGMFYMPRYNDAVCVASSSMLYSLGALARFKAINERKR